MKPPLASGPNEADGIVRGGWSKILEPGLSEFPHVILNQARVHGFHLDVMRKSPNRPRLTGWRLADLQIDEAADAQYPVTAVSRSAAQHGAPAWSRRAMLSAATERVLKYAARSAWPCKGSRQSSTA
jgi:hypothetical protein